MTPAEFLAAFNRMLASLAEVERTWRR